MIKIVEIVIEGVVIVLGECVRVGVEIMSIGGGICQRGERENTRGRSVKRRQKVTESSRQSRGSTSRLIAAGVIAAWILWEVCGC